MNRKLFQMMAGAALIAVCLATPSVAAPVSPVDIAQGLQADVAPASFWGRAYPYGYAWRPGHPCLRSVRVHTHHGRRWRRSWVCDGDEAIRSRY